MDRYLHTERAQTRQASNRLSTLTKSSSNADRAPFSMKPSKGPLTSPHRVAGASASDKDGPIARDAVRSLMPRYQKRSVMGSREFLTRSSGWRSCVQERNVSIHVVNELQREGP